MDTMDTHELAWAAGLFDGEGTTSIHGRCSIGVGVAQNEPFVLERFRQAVGRGKVYGPYVSSRPTDRGRIQYAYQVRHFEQAQYVLCLLWRWLSPAKRAQATRALKAVGHVKPLPTGVPPKTECYRGHPREGNATRKPYRNGLTWFCRKCKRLRRRMNQGLTLEQAEAMEAP